MTKSFCDACGTKIITTDYETPCMTITYPRITARLMLCEQCAEPIADLLKEKGVVKTKPVIEATEQEL